MPRIDAPTLAEHSAKRRQAVLAAASRLFAEKGYAAVSIGEIAAAAGLHRSSLYRYFPNKAQLALGLIERELDAQSIAEQQAAQRDAGLPVAEQAQRWALRHLDYASRPEHDLLVELGTELAGSNHPAAATLRGAHDQALQPLLAALSGTHTARHARWIAAMIEGIVMAAVRARSQHGAPPEAEQCAAIERAIASLVDSPLGVATERSAPTSSR